MFSTEEYPFEERLEEARRLRAEAARKRHRRHAIQVTAICSGLALVIAAVALAAFLISRPRNGPDVPDNPDANEKDPNLGQTPLTGLPDWITQDLLPVNEYSRPGTALPEVKGVVVHYVGNPNTTAWQNKNYFAGLAESHATYASSNLIVGLDGEIILCVPLEEVAYCSTVRNYDTISIEVCHPDETGKFSDTTMDSLIRLLRYLCVRYGLEREDILRHYDADGKECPMWYVKNPDDWEALRDRVFEDLNDF